MKTPLTDALQQTLKGSCLPGCDQYHDDLCPYVNGENVAVEAHRDLETRYWQAIAALKRISAITNQPIILNLEATNAIFQGDMKFLRETITTELSNIPRL